MTVTTEVQGMPKGKRTLGTSLIGIALGGGAAYFAQKDPAHHLSPFLALAAPVLAILGDQLSALFGYEIRAWWHRRGVDKTREQINDYLGNPHTSEQHKENLKRTLESLELEGVRTTAAILANPPFLPDGVKNESSKAVKAKSKALPNA